MNRTPSFLCLCVLMALVLPGIAAATPEFAKQWGSSCSSCHIGAPTGIDEEGIAFKLAGYDLGIEPENPRPKLFLSLLTDLATFDSLDDGDEMVGPEAAELFTLLRLDNGGVAKIFAIGQLSDDPDGLNLDFAHGHLQINPLDSPERLNVRLGNVEPMTRLWNSDMRRVFESSLWGGVDSAIGTLGTGGGGHHGGSSSSGRPGVLPASDWGGDLSSVIGSNLLLSAGAIGDTAYGGVFWKRGGRGFDNSTSPRYFDYGALSEQEQNVFNRQQVKLAKKWERSVIFGLSAYTGDGGLDVFDGSFLPMEDHGEEQGDEHADELMETGEDEHLDEHGEEPVDEHGDAEIHDDAFMPSRLTGSSRFVGEIKARWDRYGLYVVGVYGDNDYTQGDAEHWEEHGEFELVGRQSTDFFAWAVEGSARFKIDRRRTGRVALRYEELSPEAVGADRFQRAVANLTIPIRIMRPAVWPYLEVAHNFGNLVGDEWRTIVGVRLGY